MRYVYGISAAILLGGAAATLTVGPVGAQTAQNDPGTIASAAPRSGAPMSFADLAARLQPAVVNISTKQSIQINRSRQVPPGFEDFFRQFGVPVPDGGGDAPITQRGGSLGSGFLISADGYVVTNNHVVSPARTGATVEQITVTLSDRREFEATLVGRDPASDLALLKIKGNDLPFVRFGDSKQVRVGDWVVAIGNPFSLGGTVTAGIVSALHRNIGAGTYDRYIQTDASINMGNSGGPMFDLTGNVIGVNSALISPTGANVGIGLAIPAELAQPVIESLRKGQRPQRGYLGVGLQPIDENIASALGLPKDRGELVRTVQPGEPAARAGIQQGDVIVRVNGRDVTPDETVSYLIANTQVGSRVPIEVIRDGRRQTLTVAVGERPTEEALARQMGGDQDQNLPDEQVTAGPEQALGLALQPLTPPLAQAAGLPPGSRGVLVTGVDPNSDAAEKGIRRGDLILSVNRQPVTTPAQVTAAVTAARRAGRTSILLLVKRGTSPEAFVGVDIARP